MKISSSKLRASLSKGIAPAYLFINDEPLLLSEDRDLARRAIACEDRQLFLVERDFDFADAVTQASTGSLFGETILLEFICSEPLNASFASHFCQLASTAASQSIPLLIACPGLARRGKWTDELESIFTIVQKDEVPHNRMPGWIRARAKINKLELDDEAAEMLASMTEGNLSMAAQELNKLELIHGAGAHIDLATMRNGLADQTHDTIAGLREAMAAGDTLRAIRALRNLRAENETPPLVVWALAEEGRALLALINNGRPWGVFGTHLANLKRMAKRVKSEDMLAYLAGVCKADWASKGLSKTDPWICFERLAAAFTFLARHNKLHRNLVNI